MTATEQTSSARSGNWLANQPYLLLSVTALCWAGNAIVGRMAAGHIAPVTLSFLRWSLAFLIIRRLPGSIWCATGPQSAADSAS
jgi:drug/metabolite transporter (DMT)-like permease